METSTAQLGAAALVEGSCPHLRYTSRMKLGIVADVHCNIAGLRIALDEMGPVDELICAGDAVYQFRFSNDVVE
ncbi:MAG: metallophosphoesterase family protein, partial [Chloroflexi bacterium]|nr:metallophosphoesterase family protein [Chloroflexota bacterium]